MCQSLECKSLGDYCILKMCLSGLSGLSNTSVRSVPARTDESLPGIPGHLKLNDWDNPFQRFKRVRKSSQSSFESHSNSPSSNAPKNLARAAVYALGGTLLTTGTANYIRTNVPQIEKTFRDTSHLRIVFNKI